MKAIISDIEYSPSKEVTFVRCKPDEVFTFQEGQFMMIASDHVHQGLGKPLKKPYSIATTDRELQEEGSIGFVVKKTRDDYMSDYLTYGIKIGDVIHLQGPVGHMKDNEDHDSYLLVSVGSGLSPIRGLYQAIVAKQKFAKLVNIFGERYAEHVLPSTISEFEKNNDRIKNILFLSQESNLPVRFRLGRVQAGLDEALEFLGTTNIKVFLCGHPAMVDDVKKILIEKGVAKEQILSEKY